MKEMDILEALRQLVRQHEHLLLSEPPPAQGDPGAAAAAAGESSSTVNIGSADSAAGPSAAPGNSDREAERPHGEWADRILSLSDRLTELLDVDSRMTAHRCRLRNELLAQGDENLELRLALNRERRELERARTAFRGGDSSRHLSPPRPPTRDQKPPER